MDRLRLGDFGRADDIGNVPVAQVGFRRADTDGFVSHANMERLPIRGRINGDSPHPHLPAGPDDPEGNLSPVCDQNFFEWRRVFHGVQASGPISISISGIPYSTDWPFSIKMALTVPSNSDSISFMSFMASMMQRIWPFCTTEPIST